MITCMWKGLLIAAGATLVLSACTVSRIPSPPPHDPQEILAQAHAATVAARQRRDQIVAQQTKELWDLRLKYGQPGSKCVRFDRLSAQERQNVLTGPRDLLHKDWAKDMRADNRKIAAATILGGGLAGLGLAMQTNQEERDVYAHTDLQLMTMKDPKVNLSPPQCGIQYPDAGYICGMTLYYGNENESLCSFALDHLSLAQFQRLQSKGMDADMKIRIQLQEAAEQHVRQTSETIAANSVLTSAESEEFSVCISMLPAAQCGHDSHQAVWDTYANMGPLELVKRYSDPRVLPK